MLEQLKYWSQFVTVPGEYFDMFNGSLYQTLLKTFDSVDGQNLPHVSFQFEEFVTWKINRWISGVFPAFTLYPLIYLL